MNKTYFHTVCTMLLCLIFAQASAQTGSSGNDTLPAPAVARMANSVNISFTNHEMLLTHGELISNVLRISNNTSKAVKFRLKLDYPADWRSLYKSGALYELAPGDSIFVPVRVMPTAKILGNTRFMISAYVISDDDIQLANNFFWTFTEKKTSWSLNVAPSNKNYFKNGENTTSFKVSVLNTGTESQPIMLSLNNMSLYSTIADSNGLSLKNPNYLLNLKPFEDTTFSFNYRYFQGTRNYSRIDIESHTPENLQEEKSFAVIVNSEEPNLGGGNGFQTSEKVTFTRLSDDKKVNPYEAARIPMVVDLNVNNILSNVTFSSLTLRGNAQIDKTQMLMYNFQTTSSTNYYDKPLANSSYYVGYYYNKGSVQAGFVNGGMMGIQSYGRGLKSDYYLNRRNRIGAFYINNAGLPGSNSAYAFGFHYELKYYKQNMVRFEYGKSENTYNKTISEAYNARTGYNFLKTHTVNVNFSTTTTTFTSPAAASPSRTGFFGSVTYAGSFFKNRFATSQGYGHSTSDYANTNIERTYYNSSLRFNMKEKVSLILVNGYNTINYTLIKTGPSYSQTNQMSLNVNKGNSSFQPLAFYNIYEYPSLRYHSRGLGFSYNMFKPKANSRVSTTLMGGYNKPFNTVDESERLSIQWSGFMLYRTLTFTARYNMSPLSNISQQSGALSKVTPQNLSLSAQHQYLFSNTHFMLQTACNYYYNNVFSQHSAAIAPEMYYFTNDGWRFKVNLNYNVISGNVYNFANQNQLLSSDEAATYVNQNTFIGLGVRKEFGVPVPFVKKKNHDISFVAFFDLNGNGVKDRNEKPVENVIIGLGANEVITNENGEAQMQNFPMGLSSFSARQIDGNESWFANISDSVLVMRPRTVLVPFVRGVRIKGKVAIDRESIRADIGLPFDLSRIKITANGNKTFSALTDFQGNFEFYLPYGKYILTMDEQVLGDKYKLAKNDYDFEVNREMDGLFVSYLIVEKKRKIIRKSFSAPEEKK